MRDAGPRRVLVTGAAGMLGSQLLCSVPPGVRALGTDLAEAEGLAAPGVDLAEPQAVGELWQRLGPFEGVIHAAAYTAVDRAEQQEQLALRANATTCRVLAERCREEGARLVAVGTDFVFDGRSSRPYRPEDEAAPQGAYGRTKLAGERALAEAWPEGSAVVRTQWLYGPRGTHFPRTMVRLARERGALRVVADQVGSPTTTLELAPALWDVLASAATGVFHAACQGQCSWHQFALAVLEECGLEQVPVEPCTTEEFGAPAPRPAYSVLDSSRLTELRGRPFPAWRDALRSYLAQEPL